MMLGVTLLGVSGCLGYAYGAGDHSPRRPGELGRALREGEREVVVSLDVPWAVDPELLEPFRVTARGAPPR